MSAAFRAWDDYVYPGTNVLRNKEGIRDAARLREFEEDVALIRLTELFEDNPVEGNYDREHMKAIHRRVFGDVYEWAGEERVGPQRPRFMSKDGPSVEDILAGRYDAAPSRAYHYFAADDEMPRHFDRWARCLRRDGLEALGPEEFATHIAEPWGEMNVAHLFREGNTRTQVAFFTYFAREHGHTLDYGRFSTDAAFRHKFNAGRFLIQACDDASVFTSALIDLISEPQPGDAATVDGPTPVISVSSSSARDDYQPTYSASRSSADRCGAPTRKGSRCRRKGNCPHHE